jgi:hypothetical protein
MEYRHLGASGFKVPVLSFGTGTFGGKGEFFEAWGATDVAERRRTHDRRPQIPLRAVLETCAHRCVPDLSQSGLTGHL